MKKDEWSDLQDKAEAARNKKAKLQGQCESIMESLQDEFDVEDMEGAQDLIEQLTNEIEEDNDRIAEAIEAFEDQYDSDGTEDD